MDAAGDSTKQDVEVAFVSVSEVPERENSTQRRRRRRPSTFPTVASLNLLGALACVAGAAVFVYKIDGREQWQSTWNWGNRRLPVISPQVVLSLLHAVSTFALVLAWSKASAICWWQKAKHGLSVGELELSYRMSTSLTACFLAGRKFNLIGLATIAAAIVGLSQGPLLQKSLSIVSGIRQTNVDITGNIAQLLPFGYTGIIGGHDMQNANSWTLAFLEVMKAYNQNSPTTLPASGCNGTCLTTIEAAGLAAECSTSLSNNIISNYGDNTLFSTNVSFDRQTVSNTNMTTLTFITLTISFTTAISGNQIPENCSSEDQGRPSTVDGIPCNVPSCAATLTHHTCVLRPAIVKYPVAISNNGTSIDTINIDTSQSPFLEVVGWTNMTDDLPGIVHQYSTLGGIWLALNDMYSSALSTSYSAEGWATYPTGTLANEYMSATSLANLWSGVCTMTFNDPQNDILHSVNNIMLRTAISAAGTTDIQPISAQQTSDILIYSAEYAYIAAAIGVTAIGVLLVLPLFWGWWRLNRMPTMSPVEIAEAFGAQTLGGNRPYNSIDELLKAIGTWRVQYEEISASAVGANAGDGSTVHRFVKLGD